MKIFLSFLNYVSILFIILIGLIFFLEIKGIYVEALVLIQEFYKAGIYKSKTKSILVQAEYYDKIRF